MEKISIVVPVYNVEQYLHQCIDSIISQTYKNIEIILVDDGSEDNSGKICDEYAKKDFRIKVIHKENGGLSDARNVGIENATGSYIGFVDSDDYIAEDMYELLYNNMVKEHADISCCNRFLVYKNKEKVYGRSEFYEVMNSERAIELLCTIGYIGVSAYTKIYKRELFKSIKYPKGKVNEDMYTTYKLFDLADIIVYDAKPKYYYRQRKGSITNSGKINKNAIEASKELMIFVKKKYPKILNAAVKHYVYSSIGVYDSIIKNKHLEKNIIKYKKEILRDINEYYSMVIRDNEISKKRKIQLWLIKHCRFIYELIFKIYDSKKNKSKIDK